MSAPVLSWLMLPLVFAAAADPPAHGPGVLFLRELPADSARSDVGAGILPLADGALVTGWTSVARGPAQGLAVRVDDQGRVRWRRELGDAGADLLFAAQPDGEGGAVCAGFTTGRGAGGADGWLVALDADGATRWERTFGGAGDERLVSLRPLEPPGSGGWLACGQRTRDGDTEAWVVRLDRDGRETGAWTWGGAGVRRGLCVQPLADGGCILVGRVGVGRGEVDGFVTRLGPDGSPVWSRTVDGAGFQVAYHVAPHPDGSYLVTGYGFVDAARDHQALALRVAGDGRVLRRRELGGPGHDRATQALALDDGSTVVIGYSRALEAGDGDPVWRTGLHGLDPEGNPAWQLRLPGAGNESGHAIAGGYGRVWAVDQVSPPGGGSRLRVVRLAAPEAAGPARPGAGGR